MTLDPATQPGRTGNMSMGESQMPQLYSSGEPLDMSSGRVGQLRRSCVEKDGLHELRARMREEGYLYLPGMLNRDHVLAARAELTRRLADRGVLDLSAPAMDARLIPGAKVGDLLPKNLDDLAHENEALSRVLYDGPMIEFFGRFLDQPAMHYDFTWCRAVLPGNGTPSHCDVVYMGRAEKERLYTAWTPMGDIDFELGGLMVLAGSHRHDKLKNTYGQMDVDSYCKNKPDSRAWGKSWATGGLLKGGQNTIRKSLMGDAGQWLTAEFRAGDVLIFTMFTVHASLDNTSSNRIRLSTDSRYQPASAPADPRWVGASPVGHGIAGKLGKIC